jgi:hypothetical protein
MLQVVEALSRTGPAHCSSALPDWLHCGYILPLCLQMTCLDASSATQQYAVARCTSLRALVFGRTPSFVDAALH